ncbi:T9SS type A sorting domain-containing protein [Marivirga sericea]|nr:T9SS type A sorting domain-containing protein [Marivirga sericea]
MNRFYFLLTIISAGLLSSLSVNGQTGPAGIGNATGASGQAENFLWLDASTIGVADGADVANWSDISGNGTVFSASSSGNLPDYQLSAINGLPVVDFDDTNSERLVVNPFNNMASDEISTIIVFATANNNEAVLSYAIPSSNNEYLLFNPGNIGTYVTGPNNAGGDFSDGVSTFNIFTSVWNSSGGTLEHFKNGSSVNTGSIANGNSITNGGSLVIGGEQDAVDGGYDAGQDFSGKIAEIIAYKKSLNEAERLIIENYLSEKYSITIGVDLFSLRDGAYTTDLRGIGTADGSEKFSESGFSDALKIDEANNSLNGIDEYALFAHDNTTHAENVLTELGEPEIDDRWARSWFIENSGTVSAELIFDFGNAGLTIGSATDYVLLYRPDLVSDFSRLSVNSYAVQNSDQLIIDAGNTNLNTGYYTIGRGEQLIPGNIYSFQSGDWNDPLTWTRDPSGALRTPLGGVLPTNEDNITILAGDVVTMDSDDNDALNLTVNERLVIGNTSGHDFTNIAGGGTISIAGDASNNDNFPSGSTGLFADSIVGGTVEIIGSAINLNQDRIYNNVVLNLDNSSDVAVLTSDYTLFGDLTLQTGEFSINNNLATNSLEISTYGDVLVEAGASFTTGSGNARHEFNFYGDLSVSGTLAFTNRIAPNYGVEANDGIVDANFINDTKNQAVDCDGVSNFYRIEVDKGDDQTYILDINASSATNFNLFGPADYGHGSVAQLTTNDNALGLLRGTVRLNNNVDVPVLNNGGNYNISEAARLWINGGSAAKPNGTAIVPYGTIQLSGGTMDAPINSGITTRANGNIVVSGGVMTVNQIRTSVNGPENIGGYTQSGGTVNVTGNNISTSYYAFSLTYPGNTFNMSGGTLNVSGARTGANTGGIFIASTAGNQNVSGGTIIMEISRNDNFKLASRAPFWDVIMRKTAGSGTEVDLITGASGTGGNVTNIVNPDLLVLNDLTIEDGVTFDHNGNDVTIGSNFTIENAADYVYDISKPNTTSFVGTDNAILTFLNKTGGPEDEQLFWNVLVDRPSGKKISFESGKTNRSDNENNLFRIEGDFFKVLSGTVDQGSHSIRMYADTLVNYDEITVFNPDLPDVSEEFYENDILKLRDDGGSTVFITADTSRFGAVKLNSGAEIIDLISDLKIDYLQYKHGRINLDIHNLTIDVLAVDLTNEANGPNGSGEFSVEDMFITAGNASDGGLSLKVNADGTNPGFINNDEGNTNGNPRVFSFPVGTGTTGDNATSEFTPGNIRLLSATDEGYMTVIPVTKKLATAGPYPLGNDISDRYWIVDYRDFTTVPVVERLRFRSVERDDPTGGNPNSFPNNYVPGYVLESDPFTRTAEAEAGAPGSSGIDNVDATNIRIFFWGNEGGGNPAGGFDLINAAYTAGDASKFVGAPEIFYTRLSNGSSWYNRFWNDNNNWSFVAHDGAGNNAARPSAGDFPQAGDIAVIGYGGYDGSGNIRHSINVQNGTTVDVARIVYENPFNNSNRLVLRDNANINFDIITGTGGTFMQRYDVGNTQIITGDFGSFYNNENFVYAYYLDNNGTFNITPPTNTFPNLRVEGGNSNRIAIFQSDIVVNNDFIVDGNTTVRTNNDAEGDITVIEDLRIGGYLGGNFIFNDGQERTVEVGRLRFIGSAGSSNLTVDNTTNNGLRHRLIVNDDIIQERPGNFDLSSGSGVNDNNVIIEFSGEGNHSYSKTNGNVADFYKIVMNKQGGLGSSFTIQEDFNLLTASNTFSPLEINEGILVLNNIGIDITVLNGDLDLSIPARSGFNIAQGIVRINGDDSGILLNGSLLIEGGTLDMDDAGGNGNNFIEYSASGNAILEISDGVLNVGSQIRPITTANTGILKYRQTGGDVRIGTQAGPEGTRGMLQIYNVGSEFTFTGGTLAIERHQTTPTIAALFLDPDVSEITETINVFGVSTPVGQTDFGINSTVALAGLNINGTNNPIAFIAINPLTIDGNIFIESGASFNGNGITLTLNGDYENDGAFDAQNNEVIFSTESNQELLGTGTNNFFRFTKTGAGSLNVNNNIEINDLFTISDGNLNDGGNEITLRADAVIDGEHSSSGGNGLVFAGSSNQELRRSISGTGVLGVVSISNSNGVTIPDGNGYNFNINGGLRLNGGVFEVGGSNILLGQSADIVAVQPFSVSNMIKTNSSFADKGVGKTFPAGTTSDFTFPLGQTYYTPVVLDLSTGANSSGTTVGTIFVNPANEYHPTVDDGDDNLGSDIDNVLQYYWTLTAQGINNFSSDVTFQYNDALVLAAEGGLDETDYIAARILAFDNAMNEINKFGTVEVDEIGNRIAFNFNGDNSNGISGDYFAGIDQAIPDNVVTYVVQNSTTGDIKFSSTYTTALPQNGIPPSGAVIEIPAGSTLQLPDSNIRLYKTILNDGATLEVINSTNHRLGILEGTGTLKIISDGINATLPAFSGDFLSCSGGGLEYAGTGSYSVLGGISTLRTLTLSGSGDRNFPSNDVTICEDLVVDGPVFNASTNRRVVVNGSSTITSGTINLAGNGVFNTLGDFMFNGGVLNGNNSRRVNILGDMIIDGGTVNLGSSALEFRVFRGLTYNSGSFNAAGSGNATFIFISNSGGNFENTISGDFTGSNAFRNLAIEKNGEGENVVLNSDIEVLGALTLSDGLVIANGNEVILGAAATVSPSRGKSNSYITGKVSKPLSAGQNFAFPIGSANRWRPATLNGVNGGFTWEAQFFEGDVVTDVAVVDDMSSSDPDIETLQQGEYYVISDNATGGTASSVDLSWGSETDVASGSSDRGQLTVMVYNTATSEWDNLGGTFPSGLGTQNQGIVRSASPQSFSEKIFIMGSTDPANPLPVELTYFAAENNGSRVDLKWQTASEKSNDFFEVQRSFDGKVFEVLGIVEGAGDSKETIDYDFKDYSPLAGDSYYRLRQVDYDGMFEYSEVVRVNREQKSDLIAVPNPTQSQNIKLRLSGFHGEQKIQVSIFDMQGRRHYEAIHNPADFSKPLPIDKQLNSGIYIVDVKQGNIRKKVRLMVK